jgi:hypothetical protein
MTEPQITGGTSEQRLIYKMIAKALTGHKVEPGLNALIDVLADVIGYASRDLAEADRLVDACVPEIKQAIRTNWDAVRESRAEAENGVQE